MPPTRPRALALVACMAASLPAGFYAQSLWSRHLPKQSPPARWAHAMVWDGARERVLLFGGWTGAMDRSLGDTWEWDGAEWTLHLPQTTPGGRRGHGMAFHAARGRVVLFGGMRDGCLGDTWEWDGKTWTEARPAAGPPALWMPAMAYDAARERTVLFGGWSGAAKQELDETWEWDGAAWHKCAPTKKPHARHYHAMACDEVRKRVVLFGGVDEGPPARYLGDTWEWDGKRWLELRPRSAPPPMARHTLAWDPDRRKVVLLGGNVDQWVLQRKIWEWDGAAWRERADLPEPSVCPAAAYDPLRREMLLFGGFTQLEKPPAALNRTWGYKNEKQE